MVISSKNVFNTMITGPFGFSVANCSGVPRGHLRVLQPQVHLTYGNLTSLTLKVPRATVSVKSLDSHQPFTPEAYRLQHPAILLLYMGARTQEIPAILNEFARPIAAAQRAGARAGLQHLLSLETVGDPWRISQLDSGFRKQFQKELACE